MKTNNLFMAAFIMLVPCRMEAQDARQIAEKASDIINPGSMEMTSTLKIFDNKGNVRVREVTNATAKFGETTKTLIRFLSPADVKGTTILIYDYENKDDDMWIYLPSLRKTRRIVSSEKGKSFMGSEFSNADMSKPTMDDFTYVLKGAETFNGKDCWKVESKCKDAGVEQDNGYSRKIAWIDKGTCLTYKVEFYDANGILLKAETLSDYRKQSNGKYFAFRMNMQNLQNNRKSEIVINKYQPGSALKEPAFSANNLGE
ncbi:MAG TPA: outer membrane lipoprotein-sorting protein [Bacteroidales bacterium]|nr:outer membrane lipoprotein-sorting protein [Bacteroidales bacterium]HPT01375.1 outer membrane lipoprotein-sorting protein [Bacteroidales bacterium]